MPPKKPSEDHSDQVEAIIFLRRLLRNMRQRSAETRRICSRRLMDLRYISHESSSSLRAFRAVLAHDR